MRRDGKDSAKEAAYAKDWRRRNPEKVRVAKREWGAANKCKVRDMNRRKHLKRTYGITVEEYEAILQSQGNRCKVCRTDEPGRTGWCIDHNHRTGVVRGILCHDCNLAIGHAKDSIFLLEAMIGYLKKEG